MLPHSFRRIVIPVVTLAAFLASASPSSSDTLIVTNLGDSGAPGQLRAQINLATPGDTISIPPGPITLTGAAGEDANAGGDLDITKNLTIQGSGPGVTVIDGGGIDRVFEIVSQFATVTISNLTIRNGSLTGLGGAGIRNAGTLTLNNVIVSDSHVTGTSSGDVGGGIFNQQGTLTLNNVTVRSNTAARGGGLFNAGASTATITDSTFSGNTANVAGGGIVNFSALTITNSTFSGNAALNNSGGITNNSTSSALNVTNVTFSDNTAPFAGAIFNDPDATATLKNTIVANSPTSGNCQGTFTSLGHNLDSGTTCGFAGPGDLSNADPLLGPLADNGGPTQTHALLPGSPAINAGDNTGCPATDQRGVARPQGTACDIGAYEAIPDPAVSAFVTRLYQTVLGREPDPAGLAAFIDQIQQFGTVIPTVLAFFHSQEFLSQHLDDVQFLTVLYRTFLNREPDPEGLAAFLGLLASGCRTRDTLIAALSFSGEFRALVPPVPVSDPRIPFLAEIFAWTLNRPPDPAGFASFLSQLQRSTAVSTITGFLHSTEFTVPPKPAGEYVSSLYLVFLGRPPDCDGLFSFVGTLTPDTDAARDQLAGQFAGSQEFQAILDRVFP